MKGICFQMELDGTSWFSQICFANGRKANRGRQSICTVLEEVQKGQENTSILLGTGPGIFFCLSAGCGQMAEWLTQQMLVPEERNIAMNSEMGWPGLESRHPYLLAEES